MIEQREDDGVPKHGGERPLFGYRTEGADHTRYLDTLADTLDERGEQGWELVASFLDDVKR